MSETSQERTEQRRRLLKKAAVAPAIFVLPTGKALANTSLHACVHKHFAGGQLPPDPLPADQTDEWIRRFDAGRPSGPVDPGKTAGNYLVFDDVTNKPVAYASCWNSIHPTGPLADPTTNLIP